MLKTHNILPILCNICFLSAMYKQRDFVVFTRWCTPSANVCYVSGYFVWKRACSSFCFRKSHMFLYRIYCEGLGWKCLPAIAFSLLSMAFYAIFSKKYLLRCMILSFDQFIAMPHASRWFASYITMIRLRHHDDWAELSSLSFFPIPRAVY